MNFVKKLEEQWSNVGYTQKVRELKHGDLIRWLEPLEKLPSISGCHVELGTTVRVGTQERIEQEHFDCLESAVCSLVPWRKGPFSFFDIEIDAEWRSDLKWSRIDDHINLHGKRVLDVGSGNGYFGFRMLEAGAESVTGLESSPLPVLQAGLLNHFMESANTVIPLRFGHDWWNRTYDVTFSMGVIYHQRDPIAHIHALAQSLITGGTLVLESLVATHPFTPKDRYAGMRNVWHIPSVQSLCCLLSKCGFRNVHAIHESTTTTHEQRTTAFMPFRSLASTLSNTDSNLTIEGYPRPQRSVIVAEKV